MIVGFYPRSSGVYGQSKLKRRQCLRIRNVPIVLQDLQEGAIQVLIRIAFRKASFSDSVENGKIGS